MSENLTCQTCISRMEEALLEIARRTRTHLTYASMGPEIYRIAIRGLGLHDEDEEEEEVEELPEIPGEGEDWEGEHEADQPEIKYPKGSFFSWFRNKEDQAGA
jgi:hypothetical protein